MVADGKTASGRLAATTVLWLLIALFANQDYVFCDDEPPPPPTPEQLQQQQQQQQQQQLTQQQSLQQQQPQQQPPQEQSQQQQSPQQLTPQQQSLQQQPPQRPSMLQQSLQTMTPEMQQQFQMDKIRIQKLQQERLPRPLPQSPMSKMPQTQEPLPLEMMGSQTSLENLKREPQMISNFESNPLTQLPQLQLSPGTMPGGEQIPTLNSNPQSFLTNQQLVKLVPPSQVNELIQDPPSIPQYSAQIQQKPTMSLPSQMQRFPSNNFPSITPSMNQQHFNRPTNIQQRYQSQFPNYSQVYANDRYERPMRTSSNTQAFPGQSYLPMNFGSDMMQPMQTFTNMMSSNPLQIVQRPIDLALNSFDKAGRYVQGVKDGLATVVADVAGRIIDQGQSTVHKILGMTKVGTDAAFDFNRHLFIPAFRNQQVAGSGVPYNYPQRVSQSNVQDFNSRLQPSTEQGGMQGYNTLQPQTSGSFAGQQPSTQITTPPQTQYGTQQDQGMKYGTQQNQEMEYGNRVDSSQPIVHYGS